VVSLDHEGLYTVGITRIRTWQPCIWFSIENTGYRPFHSYPDTSDNFRDLWRNQSRLRWWKNQELPAQDCTVRLQEQRGPILAQVNFSNRPILLIYVIYTHTFLECEVELSPGSSPGVRQSIIFIVRRQSFFNHVLSNVKKQKLIK